MLIPSRMYKTTKKSSTDMIDVVWPKKPSAVLAKEEATEMRLKIKRWQIRERPFFYKAGRSIYQQTY